MQKIRQVLATDLDGTLIPLAGHPQHHADLRTLAEQLHANEVTLVFVTGRHFASVQRAIDEFQLPVPDWIICDVGTSVFERQSSGKFRPIDAYGAHLRRIIASLPLDSLRECLAPIAGLRLQEPEKQGPFKLSYYADAGELNRRVAEVQLELDKRDAPYSIIHSCDPFNGDGLIDILPATVSKAHALDWWSGHVRLDPEAIVFAGDSGNDLAALTSGHRAIVVANADHAVIQQAYNTHREAGWQNRLCNTRGAATSGVLEGCRWFELIAPIKSPTRRLGATPLTHNRTYFRVWAPKRIDVSVELIDRDSNRRRYPLAREEFGYFCGEVSGAAPHMQYQYLLDGHVSRPDPASTYQPDGVHGASEIIRPEAFPWTDGDWPGVCKRDLIIYELHVGAFTEAGTFHAAIERLGELVDLGVTAVELLPVAQSPGRWNWGYDGVDLFAVRNTYGEPDDFKAFVDACHRRGLAVLLDVVYNHVGPEGNYLADFGPYFSRKHGTPWGEAFNFDGRHAQHVRQFIIQNAIRWLDEYHLDGLRLDAVHFMHDEATPHILTEIRRAVSEWAATVDRVIHLIAEANVYDHALLIPEDEQSAYDAAWCDCLMHSVYSHALPQLRLAHRVYRGADDLAEVLQHGYLYCFGGREPMRVDAQQRREFSRAAGHPPIASFVTALQTHDGVGNHPHGKRLHQLTSKQFQRAAAALTLLYPSIPLIFMGEESASESVFPFFSDFEDPRLRAAVDRGRANEYPQHVWSGAVRPSDPKAFLSAKCHRVDDRDESMRAWYAELLKFRQQGLADGWLSPSCLTAEHDDECDMFSLRYVDDRGTAITVQARLASPDRHSHAPAFVASDAELLLSSEPVDRDDAGRVRIHPNQAVVTRCSSDGK